MSIREQLFNKFRNGQKPNGDDFRTLIENSFNDNVEVYTQQGIQTQKVKFFVGTTEVKDNSGEWEIDFSNINYTNIFNVISSPVQNKWISDIEDVYLASVVHENGNNYAKGLAFNASVKSYEGEKYGISLAKRGTLIQVLVIGY